MKTKIPFILALTLTAALAQAAPSPALTVAVYDFTGDPEAASYGGKVTTLVTADLTTETNLVMLERADLNKALNEEAFGISGMVSADAAAKIGQLTGAKVLVAGQVLKTGEDHLAIVACIIGTETGRLFADQVEGAADNVLSLTSDLSRKIARTITDQATNLVTPPAESHDDHVDRIVKSVTGTNRPSVSISINQYDGRGENWNDWTVENEFGLILLKAGFAVVDDKSDRKPDVEIAGSASASVGTPRGGLVPCRAVLEVKIQERRTGDIIGLDHQESVATDIGDTAAQTAAQIKTTDDLAERILPLLAK